MARRSSLRGPSQGARRADALITLLDERDFGLLTSVLSLLNGLVVADSARRALAPSLHSLIFSLVPHIDIDAQIPRLPAQGCPPAGAAGEKPGRAARLPVLLHPLALDAGTRPPLAHLVRSDPRAQIKCMRILQQFPVADDPTIARVLSPILQHVISVRVPRAPHALLPSEPAATLRRARTRPKARTRTTRCRR